ncbi:hypothetical protein HDF23_001936 [Mucilaginibacter lappiensis]|uniref:Peptidase M1 membrane alanine aminopeptidase domain-containing protein n=1 Tax=Mucilaginibacter lappiensis TaxID=354630 RepID=A0ABR6PHF2_9SPHI|nr:M1 family metallopeptidase [Mucilaginibacter lappiensis]MBB6109193.1 hypothetical protein [Mucilaginibacter lappiensis]
MKYLTADLKFIKKSLSLLSLIIALLHIEHAPLRAQCFYYPRDLKQAFKNKTRSIDGKPGKNYWQNHGSYNITLTVLPPNRNIRGTEQIVYSNNSPDTLKELNMKLIMNIHKPGAARFANAQSNYLTQGVQMDSFSIDGQSVAVNNEDATTNQPIALPKPLLPHQSVKLDITWHFELALGAGREGAIDSTSFYLGYFYPRVAVYDDYNGWDKLPFLDVQEFYNDFNDYTLRVKAPADFLVWATGTLQNPKEVLQPEYAKRLERSINSDSIIHIVTPTDLSQKNITTKNKLNTWVWKADNISDMAVGVSDQYVWDAASIMVDHSTHRRASIQAAYLDNAADFHSAVKFGQYALKWFSNNLPGVPYPYPKMTIFQGYADMEYPMMVNASHKDDLSFAQLLLDHEISHTWFPFYMGTNESRYGFMDEGWATTFERLIGATEIGQENTDALWTELRVKPWISDPSAPEDLPIITPSSELRDGLSNNEYGKPALSHFALKDLLGDELFKKSLKGYMDNWHDKHPVPWDYFNSMSDKSGRNLNWFFNNWFFSNSYIDLSLQKVNKSKDGYSITIKNTGGFYIPFDVKITCLDGTCKIIHQTPAIWEQNPQLICFTFKTDRVVKAVEINTGVFLDANISDNIFVVK